MKHLPMMLYYSQMNGQMERMIGTITGILTRIAKIENNWNVQLLQVQFSIIHVFTYYTYTLN